MPNITVKTDCENSPKMMLLREFNIAFAENNNDFIMKSFADDIEWTMVGETTMKGIVGAKEMLSGMTDGSMTDLTLETIMTHGDVGAVNGWMKFNDGKKYAFCDVYGFSSHTKDAKINSLKSYVVEIK